MKILNENNIIRALNEELSESTLDEYCSYLYDYANGEVDDIPSYEETKDYYFDCSKQEYKKIYNMVKTAIENVADNLYSYDNGKLRIELSDRSTLNNLSGNIEDVDPEQSLFTYEKLRDEAFKKFEEETGVEIWQDGRSGRHIVVDDNFYNAYHYNELCDAQEKWEDWVIDEFAKAYPFTTADISKTIQTTGINEEYMYVKDADYIDRGNWSDGAVRYKGFIYNAYDIQEGLGEAFESYLREEGKEVPSDNSYYAEFNKWIKENPDLVKSETEELIWGAIPESIDENILSEIRDEYSYERLVETLNSWKTRTEIPEEEINKFIEFAKEHCENRGELDIEEESELVAEVVGSIIAILEDKDNLDKWFSDYGMTINESSYGNNKLLDAVKDYGIVSVDLDENKQTITFRVPRATKENDGYVCATVDFIERVESALREIGMDVDVFGEGESAKDFGTFTLTYEPKAKGLYNESSIPRNAKVVRIGDDEYFKDGSHWGKTSEKDLVIPRRYPTGQLKMQSRLDGKDIEVIEVDKDYKPKRTKEYRIIQGNYGNGWDDLVSYDTSDENQRKDLKQNWKDYNENEPNIPHRIITRREPLDESVDFDKLIDNDMTIKELDETAQWLYDNDRAEWDKFTDNEIIELAKLCQITDENPGGRAYDDEVFDEMDRRGLKLSVNEEVTKSEPVNATSNQVNQTRKIRDYLNYELEDDDTEVGGVSFNGETVEDFIGDTDLKPDDDLDTLNKALVSCGIRPVNEACADPNYRGDDYWDLSDEYVNGNLSDRELYAELSRLYCDASAVDKAYKEITDGKDIPSMGYEDTVKVITPEEAEQFIMEWNNDRTSVARGRFIAQDGDTYIAIDNRTGDCWTEEFNNRGSAIDFLESKMNESSTLSESLSTATPEDIMCGFIGDLFKNMSEGFKFNSESLYDWCEGGDTFRNAGYDEETCKKLDRMLEEINPLIQEVNGVLYHYAGEDIKEG